MLTNIISKANHTSISRIFFGVILIAASAQIIIPIKPVPITLQTVAAILIGLLYNPREAMFSWVLYLACGALGMPIFNNFGYGIERLLGPTAGYFLGMSLASYLIAYIRSKDLVDMQKFTQIIMLVFFAQIIIYSLGILWLSQIIGAKQAIISGCLIFIPSGIIKSLIISLIFRYIYNAKTD